MLPISPIGAPLELISSVWNIFRICKISGWKYVGFTKPEVEKHESFGWKPWGFTDPLVEEYLEFTNHRKIIGKSLETHRKHICKCAFIFGHFYNKFMEIISLKAPGNYSGSIWTDNFSFCLWQNLKIIISMVSRLSNASPSPKTNIIYLWRHQDTWTDQETNPQTF